jgi:hypothetical protein
MLQSLFENVHSHNCSSPGQRRIAANIAKLPELLRRAEHGPVLMSAFGGKADMSGSGLLPGKLTPEPHFAGRKSLL